MWTYVGFGVLALVTMGAGLNSASCDSAPAADSRGFRGAEGANRRVNLTTQAEHYMSGIRKAKPDITDWGLTGNYSYWNSTQCTDKHPIQGNVEYINCTNETKGRYQDITEQRVCETALTWTIYDEIFSPFSLLVNVTVPMIPAYENTTTLQLDLNNATTIRRRLYSNDSDFENSNFFQLTESCMFSAGVFFEGWFAHQNKEGNYTPVGVGDIENKTEELVKQDEKTLAYKIRGKYEQVIYCQVFKEDLPKSEESSSSGTDDGDIYN